MPDNDPTVEAVRRLFVDVFVGGNEDLADAILTDDFTFQYPFPGFPSGRRGIISFSRLFRSAFDDFEVEILNLFRALDHPTVSIRWIARGKHVGDFLGLSATGKEVSFTAIGEYGPGSGGDPGRLAFGFLEMDTLGLLQQLRAMPLIAELLPGLRHME